MSKLADVARSNLIKVYVISLTLCVLGGLVTYFLGLIETQSFIEIMLKAISIYSVPFGIIAGGAYGQRNEPLMRASSLSYHSALVLSLLWNSLVVLGYVLLLLTDMTQNELQEYLGQVVPVSSWLMAGGLTFFFSSRKEGNGD